MLELKLDATYKYELVLHDTAGGIDGGISLKLRTKQCSETVNLVLSPFFQGPKGDTGSGDFDVVAGEAMNANTPVVVQGGVAYKASNLNAQHLGCVFGISQTATLAGESVKIVVLGILENQAWNLSAGPVFLGNGVLTQTVPTSGFVQILGTAMSASKMSINLQQPFSR